MAVLRSDGMPASRHIAVIGAGWAGCAAAVELADAGHRVTLIESSRTLGGRARAVAIDGRTLDNGQHILLGAYTESLRLMRKTGVDTEQALLRLPLQMRYPSADEGMDFVVPRLPAPWHVAFGLWRAKGLTREDKIALLRFTTAARWIDWRLDTDCSVDTLLRNHEQTDRLIRLMWTPLCVAALNTPPERASARIFLNVLRDSLGARRAASDMLIPRADLTALFPQAAANFVTQHGGEVLQATAIRGVASEEGQWRLVSNAAEELRRFDGVIIATPASQVNELLSEVARKALIPAFDYEPITTCYLQYGEDLKLPAPFLALLDDPAAKSWGQFVFDRGQLDGNAGLLAVVISASTHAIERDKESLMSAVAEQLARAFAMPQLKQPLWTQIITEKRATFSCTPDLQRPTEATPWKGLVLAGDYLASDYPATLESAVRSGVRAAALLDTQLRE